MINYRNGKEKIKVDKLGSLYIDRSKIEDGHRPLIYIGGQMEHRGHVLEQTGFTGDVGHNMFDGSWFFDYPNHFIDKSTINAKEFASNLLLALKKADIPEIDLLTVSYGGMIAAAASSDKSINKVVAVHPPYLGTPLASRELIASQLDKLTFEQKVIAKIVNVVVNESYGFEQENGVGIIHENISDSINPSKITVVGSNIDIKSEKNSLVRKIFDLIFALTGEYSDGVVIHNKEEFEKLGLKYIEEPTPVNHLDAQSKDNLERAKRLVLK